MRRWLWLAAVGGCLDGGRVDVPGDTDPADTDAPHTDAVDTEVVDTDAVDPVARGAYLVEHVVDCGSCHTPRLEDGTRDPTRHLAGAAMDDPLTGDTDGPVLYAPNLTADTTGLADWTDEEVRRAVTAGRGRAGEALWPQMPSWLYGRMSRGDADAVVAYLRTLPAVTAPAPERTPFPLPVDVLDDVLLPASTLDTADPRRLDAVRGRYLVGIGGCVGCHSPDDRPLYPIAPTRVLAGGRVLLGGGVSPNLTPDAHGLAGWTADDVAGALKRGQDKDGRALCGPMSTGPDGALGGLTDDDALAIGTYLTTIPPIASDAWPSCPPG